MNYVVYLTLYTGSKLPRWYIGSTSYSNILNGYNGSVGSKLYKKIYLEEQKYNKHLFKTKVLSRHTTRKEALSEELRLQEMHKVINNPNYINKAYAKENGFVGLSLRGKEHPQFGIKHPDSFGENISKRQNGAKNTFFGKFHSEESKQKLREKSSGINNHFTGKSFNDNSLQKIKDRSGTCKGTFYIFNETLKLCRRVNDDEFSELEIEGWNKGRRVYKHNVDKITIYNKDLRKNRKIYPIELDYFLNKGWKKGKYNFNRKKRSS